VAQRVVVPDVALQFSSDVFVPFFDIGSSPSCDPAPEIVRASVVGGRIAMKVLSRLPRERHGFDHRFVANDNDASRGARDVAAGERWTFVEHRDMAEVIVAEGSR
jgi:hypothetical protein